MTLSRLKRGKKGQFIIIATLLVAILIISVASIMYGAITYFRHEQWEEYLSIIDQVRISSQRLMEINLANFTKTRFENHAPDRSVLKNILNRWKNDLKKGLPGLGLSVDFLNSSQLLSPSKLVGGSYIPERRVYNFVKCYWYYPASVSSAYADLSVNVSKFGLYGYRVPILLYLNTEVDISYLDEKPAQIDSLTITVTREQQSPVTGLKVDNFLVHRFDPSVEDWVNVTIKKVTRRLGGGYMLTFENSIEKPYYKWLFVTVIDTRGITVVSSTYSYIEFIVEKQTPTANTTRPLNTPDEIYTLEAGVKGQWYWNGKQLDFITEGNVTATPPIPPIPIKQFRVNATGNGVDSALVERPCQYEIWDKVNWHGSLIDVPRGLADPYYQFNSTNRMVFQVQFPALSIPRQKVRIWWMDDIDAEPYQGPSDLVYYPDSYVAKTNVYDVEFMGVGNTASPDYEWDYYGVAALLLKDRDTGESYGPWNLHGFDLAPTAPGTAYWRPHGQWEIKYWYGETGARAVVRLIAIVNSTEVNTPWQSGGTQPRSDYYDTYAVAFITANVKYLQQRVWVYWKQNQSGNGLWLSWEWGKGETKWYAYLNNQTGNVAGPYTYDYSSPTIHIEYDYPGYWAAHWNDEGLGRGLIFNVEGLNSLYSFDENRTSLSVTTQAPGGFDQGSIEFEAIRCGYPDPEEYTVTAGTSYSYIPSTWMYGGGNQTDGYKEVVDYYYMFLEPYAPKIIIPEEG